jgi:hypothetical protein
MASLRQWVRRWFHGAKQRGYRFTKPRLEGLEDRLVPATLPVDATHSLISQLAAASPGDIVQIEPSGTIGSLGTTAATLVNATVGGATSITVTNFIAPGQVITIDTGGNAETALVDAEAAAGSNFTLTLHSGLSKAHSGGVAVTPLPHTIGIGKAVTLQGDPANPVSSLLNAFTIELFPQNGAAGPDTLQRLALTAVSGTTSSNLTIAGNTFNIAAGTTDPIDVTSGGALSVLNDAFTIGSGATIDAVVSGTTNAGAITFTGNKIGVTGNVDASSSGAVALSSDSGPITAANDSLTVTGGVGNSGIYVNAAGNAALSSISETVTGAVENSGIRVNGADLALSNLTVNLGGTASYGIDADASGDLTLSGTNSVTIKGNVTNAGVYLTGSGNATVPSITVDLKANAAYGVEVDPSGNIAFDNANVTVAGNATSYGIYLDDSSSISVSNVTLLVKGSAGYGLYAYAYSNLSLAGTESVTVTGAVSSDGMYLDASDGNLTVSTSLGITLGSSASYGLYAYATGNLNITGTVSVQVTGAVSFDGAYIDNEAAMTLSTVDVTLDNTAGYGLYVEAYTLNLNGAITAKVSGNVSNDAAYVYSYYGDLTVANTISVSAGAAAGYGLYLYSSESALLDSHPITVNVAGNASSYGAYIYARGRTSLSGALSVTVGGTADYGLYLYSDAGYLLDTAGITVKVTGAGSSYGAYLYAYTNMTVSNITVTLADTASGEGLYAEAYYGQLNITGVTVTANGGTSSAYGAYLYDYYGGIVASNITIAMNAMADYGLYVYAGDSQNTLTNAKIQITGTASYGLYDDTENGITASGININLAAGGSSAYGAYLYSYYTAINASNFTITIGGPAKYGMYLDAGDSPASLTNAGITVTGAVSSYGLYAFAESALNTSAINVDLKSGGTSSTYGAELENYYGSLLASNVSVTMNGPADYGLYVDASDGPATVSGATVQVTGAVSSEGLYAFAESALHASTIKVDLKSGGTSSTYGADLENYYGGLLASNISVTMNGPADYGLYVDASDCPAAVSGATVQVSGAVSSDGIYAYADGALTLTGLSANLGNTADYGMYLENDGVLTVNGPLSVSVTGAVSNDGLYLYNYESDTSITAPISVTLGSTAGYGAYLYGESGNLTDSAPLTVSVAGNVTDYGAYIYANSNLTLGGNVSVTVGGSAQYGLYAEAGEGYLKNAGTIAASVAGQITSGGEGTYLYGDTGAMLSNISVTVSGGTASNTRTYYGADIEAYYGDLHLSNLKVQVKGTVAASFYGLYLYSDTANIFTSNINVSLGSTAEDGLYVDASDGNVTMTGTSLTIAGDVSQDGAYIYGSSAMNISGFSSNLHGASKYGLYFEAYYGNMTVSSLQFQEAGAVTNDAVYLQTDDANLAASNFTISLGSTAGDDGFYPIAGKGDLSVSGVKLTATGLISNYGFEIYSQGDMTVSNNSIKLNGGVTNDDMYAESYGGNLTISQNSIVNKGSVSAGIDAFASGTLTLSKNTVQLTGGTGTAALLSGASGNLQSIIDNVFSTAGAGTGLAFSGGPSVAALVQDNNFQGNKVGVAIVGDNTNAGNIDLGGGLFGSLGGNNFDGFTGTAGNEAISLTKTNATSSVFALHNLFSAGTNPLNVIQDQAHNGGTGIIDV